MRKMKNRLLAWVWEEWIGLVNKRRADRAIVARFFYKFEIEASLQLLQSGSRSLLSSGISRHWGTAAARRQGGSLRKGYIPFDK